jgi:cytochrome P450
VSLYSDIQEILRDPITYSSEPSTGICPAVPAEASDRLPNGWPFHPSIASTDPPEHLRLRRLAQKAFTTSQAKSKEEAIAQLAHDTIDAFIDDKKADLSTQYAQRIPVRVVAPIFGVSPELGPKLHKWALEVTQLTGNPRLSHEQLMTYAQDQIAFTELIAELIDERRKHPRGKDDLLTALIDARDDEGEAALTNHEIASLIHSAISAGSETAATTIGHAIYVMLSERTIWEELTADTTLAANAVEETLRFLSTSRGVFRKTTREVELRGVLIPAGATLYLMLASSGRDPEAFDDPDRFDIHRSNAKTHLGLGLGTHFCLGAPLSRAEVKVALKVLAERIPSLRLSPDVSLTHMSSMRVPAVLSGLIAEWD